MAANKHYALVGFANAGKSTLFNQLCQAKQVTGNWTGVTVDIKQQGCLFNDEQVIFSDIPGIPSLSQRSEQSQDISISQQFLAETRIDCLINVVDASQLKRQLYLTTQLLELGLPMLVVLNKFDRKEAMSVDIAALSQELGCPVITLDGRQNSAQQQVAQALKVIPAATTRPEKLTIPQEIVDQHSAGDSLLKIEQCANAQRCNCHNQNQKALLSMQSRYRYIEQLMTDIKAESKQQFSVTDKLDNVILHPWLGIPFFLLMMYALFMFAINVGSAFIDFFDILAGAIFVEYPQQLLSSFALPVWLLTLIAGVGSGIQTVATFIPVIVCLFIGLSLLEASGYLARAAFVVESFMQKIGLPGKAFVPLIVGFGCTVPAVMSARVLDSERERITTVMMSPFMSCGARLPVYALFAAAFFPESGQNLVFLLYLIGIAAAIGTGFLLKVTILAGHSSMNIMELPLYELPKLSYLLKRVWQRTHSFIFGAGKTIVVVVCLLNFFNSLGTDGEFGHEETGSSVLSKTAQVIVPVLAPMGIKEDNWQAGVGIITGLFAKEALVATFNSLYSSATEQTAGPVNFADSWLDAVNSVKENLLGLTPTDPLGVDVGDVSTLVIAAEQQQVAISTYTALQSAFAGQLGAFSYLLFILLYTPCAAAMGAIKNEVGNRWAAFAGLWSLTLAYLAAVLCFQVGAFSTQPFVSTISISVVVVLFAAIYLWLKHLGGKILTIPTQVSYH